MQFIGVRIFGGNYIENCREGNQSEKRAVQYGMLEFGERYNSVRVNCPMKGHNHCVSLLK